MSSSVPLGAVALEADLGTLGTPGTRLLDGPNGAETLAAHLGRLGEIEPERRDPALLRARIAESGLLGRGGGQFPAAKKLETAASAGGRPLVVVNASESEPASKKDELLLSARPHLVLDGLRVAAAAIGATEAVVYRHRERSRAAAAVEQAVKAAALGPLVVHVVDAPAGYVSGEASAIVSFLEGRPALPARRPEPAAARGVAGRPTVVHNVETLAHLALIERFGPGWFRRAGSHEAPGSTLLTLDGAVARPGLVVEAMRPVTIGELLRRVGGLEVPPAAVLLGGYSGTWLAGNVAWTTPLDRGMLRRAGASLGCGLIGVLPSDACGLAVTANLTAWLASQSAGQCGPCRLGLPELAELVEELAFGPGSRITVREARRVAAGIVGRGGCGHPNGVVQLVETALETFADELARHRRGRCSGRATVLAPPGAR